MTPLTHLVSSAAADHLLAPLAFTFIMSLEKSLPASLLPPIMLPCLGPIVIPETATSESISGSLHHFHQPQNFNNTHLMESPLPSQSCY